MAPAEREPIAIIGSGCRFPGGASTPSKLWELLRQPRDVARKIDRFNYKGFYHADGAHHGTTNVTESYLLAEDHRVFDAQFFNIKPVEADAIDPMQRILMETVYESIENAGQSIEGLQGSDTAFYAGVMSVDYVEHLLQDLDTLPTYFATGTSRAIISNRVSYFFDWHGPSMTIDTACSSSLIALHQAVQSLRLRESSVAVAAGADLILRPEVYIGESKLNMLSPNGRSRMWDSKADGYARGEGFASVVCKRLSDAIADGDHIECIVRETATNQDGRTKGITMPNPDAQVSMIRGAYKTAGLDLNKEEDRPQFFEAHGTGTPAGDPLEAEAICKTFFGSEIDSNRDFQTLEVGSIKTVVGHTEGTAGLAGVMKASLALQHGIVPPNLLFENLSPSVAPFYQNLHIPTAATPWPKVAGGGPRRASVNSFGFGGSNAHAILESYEPSEQLNEASSESPAVFTPFTFSATTERSLKAIMKDFSDHLKNRESLNLRDLAWTLSSRKSKFPFKASISASTQKTLISKIDAHLEAAESKPIAIKTINEPAIRILGVFTGQGAQWPSMGKELIRQSPYVKQAFETLEGYLSELPQSDRPSWFLTEQLIADAKASRLGEASLSQPLCTAVQIVLVDLIKAAGIKFGAVVGHSSGEIGAAYAAGYLTAPDALKIAYYRGLHAKLARGPEGQKGAMLAAGTSLEDAQELCDLPFFKGRMTVGASNSSSSVTLSGDADAISHAKLVLEDEKKFSRALKVDTAYHSHHMYACSKPYTDSLNALDIKVQSPDVECTWFSSVKPQVQMEVTGELTSTYWRDNMVSTVLFSQAIENAVIAMSKFDLALEIGPHPALKGPATQTIDETSGLKIPYTGVLSRGTDDVEALSDALGFAWTHLGPSKVDFDGFNSFVMGGQRYAPKLVDNLPSYSWDHGRVFWSEGRIARQFCNRELPPHPLLGIADESGTERESRWRNVLLRKELPWLEGHQVQHQMVYPAAGYVSMAVEASKSLAKNQSIHCIELLNLDIAKAITFDDENSGVETLCTLATIAPDQSNDESTISADFMVYCCLKKDSGNLTLMASCRVQVILGDAQPNTLPPMPVAPPNMHDIDLERFYQNITDVGLNYSGPFRTMSSMQRKLGFARGTIAEISVDSELTVQPPTLDIAFHGVMSTWFFPGDGRLWRLMLPRSIDKVTVNPCLHANESATKESDVYWNAILTDEKPGEITGNVELFPGGESPAALQIEGLRLVAFQGNTAADDRRFYSEIVWGAAVPDIEALSIDLQGSPSDIQLATALERVVFYFWRSLNQEVSPQEDYHKRLHQTMNRNLLQTKRGSHPSARKEWMRDTREEITALMNKYPDSVDMELLRHVDEHLADGIAGYRPITDQMTLQGTLEQIVTEGLGVSQYRSCLDKIVQQMIHRYPHMSILEIGAGSSNLAKSVAGYPDQPLYSYTFADKNVETVERARKSFGRQSSEMASKLLDVENDPISQGFAPNSYDLIIVPASLQFDSKVEQALSHLRSLIKPGGRLLLQVMKDDAPMRMTAILGRFPEYWVREDDGHSLAPIMSASVWNSLLRQSGFSGVDLMTADGNSLAAPFNVICSQAVNEQVKFLRRPLLRPSVQIEEEDLYIIGGNTIKTMRLVEDLTSILQPRCSNITIINSVEEIDHTNLPAGGNVISLVDLDEPLFKNLTPTRWNIMKVLFDRPKEMLWLTQGRLNSDPYSSMTIGFWRSVQFEAPHVKVQFLDFEKAEVLDPRIIAETYLQNAALRLWERSGQARDIVWSNESELVIRNGKVLIPRAMAQPGSNNRLNAERREIKNELVPAKTALEIEPLEDSYHFRASPTALVQDVSDTKNMVNFTHSLLFAVVFPSASLYLGLGTVSQTGEQVLALSESNASLVNVPKDWIIPCEVLAGQESAFLLTVVGELLATAIVTAIPVGGVLVLHEPNPLIASILNRQASKREIQVIFVTNDVNRRSKQWIYIHPRASQYVIADALPANVSTFVDLRGGSSMHGFGNRVADALPDTCKKEKSSTLMSKYSKLFADLSVAKIPDLIKHAAWVTHHTLPREASAFNPLVSPHDLANNDATLTPFSILDWTSADHVPVTVEPINPQLLFSRAKTYFLVGLTGDIGRSITQWMAKNGAGHIVMTSRNPNVDPNWLKTVESLGATIKVSAMDVTDIESVQSVYDEVCATLPPIAGVANAAMVLRDQVFSNMDFEDMDQVLKPKVDGTNNLQGVFMDVPLDFFILFSSLACVIGNIGQSNYSTANMYMTALAAQRKQKGLAASVMDIGRVVGVGYLGRADASIDERLAKYGMMAVSETDLHHQFAEAVMAGRPGSSKDPELISGLAQVEGDEDDDDRRWAANTMFSHFVTKHKQAESKATGGQAKGSVKAQLEAVANEAQALDILQACFCLKLQNILQLPPDGVGKDTPLVELGVDSLVAVEIRTWFLKEIQTDMPVLKVLGGASAVDLCRIAVEKLPKEFCPGLAANKQDVPERPRPAREQTQPFESKKTKKLAPTSQSSPMVIGSTRSSSVSVSPSPEMENSSDGDTLDSTSTSSLSLDAEKTLEGEDKSNVLGIAISKGTSARPPFQRTERQSLSQSRFWFLSLYVKDQTTFNVTFYHRITGNLDVSRLASAVKGLGQHHEILRTAFFAEELDTPMQGVMKESHLRLERKNIISGDQAVEEYEKMKAYIFDIKSGEVMRILLLSRSSNEHFIIFGHPHILMDGVSFQIFMRDLETLYKGNALSLSGTLQYLDFAKRQRAEIDSGNMDEEVIFWKEIYPNVPHVLPLFPMAETTSRKPLTKYGTNNALFRLDKQLATRIKAACIKNKVTNFHFYLAAFKVLLFRFLDTEDLSIGIADANRNDAATLGSLGLYLNLLPLRFKSSPESSFAEALREARTKSYSALEHSRLPFDVLLDKLNVQRSSSHSPLFQAFFDYRQGAKENLALSNVNLQLQDAMSGENAYDITLDVTESNAGPIVVLRGQDYLYSKASIETILKSFVNLLEAFSADTNVAQEKPSLFGDKDLKHAVQLGKGRPMESTWPETLAHRIDDVIAKNPDKPALKDVSGKNMTFAQMARQMNSIAAEMIARGVTPGSRVAVFQEATSSWICSLLAIMRIGAVYVPLDLRNPLPRLATVVKSSNAEAILAHAPTLQDVPALGAPAAATIDISNLPESSATSIVPNQAKADSPAVILFTSGSTGTPKGIVLPHRTLCNEIEGYTKMWDIGAQTVLQQSAFSFDFSMDQIFTALANAGKLVIVSHVMRGDSVAIAELIREEKITYTKATPSEYSNWIEFGAAFLKETTGWKLAFAGGELLTNNLLREVYGLQLPDLRFFNSYGPAEASIASTKMEIPFNNQRDIAEMIPAGIALPNYSLYVVDKHLNAVPVGMPGQIAIGGAGPGFGYLNDDVMTKQKFVRDPFASDEYIAKGWTTMYLTGDKGRLRDDGALLFDGRIDGDTQIKLRGLRIELTDIESTIIEAAKGHLMNAIVTVRGDAQFLVAHVVFSPEFDLEGRDRFLRQLLPSLPLPSYMIPAIAVALDNMPLNSHSKVDRPAVKNLPLPKAAPSAEDRTRLTEVEARLKQVWETTVGPDIFAMHTANSSTDFFHIGGNSLLLVKLQSLIRDNFNVALPLLGLFDASTLGKMAATIQNSVSVSMINWTEETSVSKSAMENDSIMRSVDSSRQPKSTGRTVLLTGATGYLGKHLLPQLEADNTISKIVCIAIRHREDSSQQTMDLSLRYPKVVTYSGDLTAPLLGLSPEVFNRLGSEADTIIHCGARRSFWDNYHQLRTVNVSPTRELVKLASARRIPIHFTSSAGVLHLAHSSPSTDAEWPVASSVSAHTPPLDGSNGYVASKWASERLLENAAQELGIPITIIRFVPASRQATSTATASPEILHEFLKYANQVHSLPLQDGWDGYFDLIPVRDVVRGICDATTTTTTSSLNSDAISVGDPLIGKSHATARFTHYQSGIKISIREAFEYMAQHGGREKMARMPLLQWIGSIKRAGFRYLFASHDVALRDQKGQSSGSGVLISKR